MDHAGKLNILLVDDRPDKSVAMRSVLDKLDENLVVVRSGKEALKQLLINEFALVLLDVNMPVMDGFETANLIRGRPSLEKLPIIFITAATPDELQLARGYSLGAVDFIFAPVSGEIIKAKVSAILELHRKARDLEDVVRQRTAALQQSQERYRLLADERETLNELGKVFAAELDTQKLVQAVTDTATRLVNAQFGAFFYNVIDEKGESYSLYTVSGVPREMFSKFPRPRNTEVFGPTFTGQAIVRSGDITKDPRYGKNAPYHGMPKGHLPVKSYLAAPVISRSGEVLGGLFFGHAKPDRFTDREERMAAGLAAQAAVALDNARLYSKAQQEIAERKRSEEALRESEERFRAFVTASSDVVYRMSADWKEMRQLQGRNFIPDTNGANRNWLEKYIHPDDQPRVLAAIQEAIRTKTKFELEYRVIRVDGTSGWTFSRTIPLLDERNEIVEWIGTASDVTRRKQAEEALREAQHKLQLHASELEQKVEERTAKLRETIQELEAFSYSISHDMRGPLRAMEAYARALLEDFGEQIPDEGKGYVKRIGSSAVRLDGLISDVLAYSRVLRAPITAAPVDVERLLDEIIDQYPAFQAPKAEIEIHPPLTKVLGHEASLTQCITNLLGNAVKFVAPEKIPKVKIWAEPRDDEIRLWFEDNGIGIAPRYQQRIFEMFQRVHPEQHYEGTGIGLAIVRKAVERMGGTYGLESDEGKGSRFWIQLKKA